MVDVAVIDRPVLDQLLETFGGDREFFGEMLDIFFEDSPRQLAALRSGLERADSEAVRRAAHTFKSNCANFGALALAAQCRSLELLAKEGLLEGGAERFAEISAGYEQVKIALQVIKAGG